MKYETFEKGMLIVTSIWDEKKLSKPAMAAYWQVLRKMSDELFLAAIEEGCKDWTFLPRPGDIWTVAEQLDIAPLDESVPTAEDAWDEVEFYWHRWRPYGGEYDNPPWTHPAVGECAKLFGGLRGLATTQDVNKAVIRGQFVKYFTSLRKRYVEARNLRAIGKREAVAALQEAARDIGRLGRPALALAQARDEDEDGYDDATQN